MELDTLSTLLVSNELLANEMQVFQVVIRWAGLKCSSERIEPTAFNKRKVAAKLVPLIRFPLMKVQDFTNEVVTKNTGFLTEQECLQLLVYLTAGSPRAQAAIPGLFFSKEKRTGSIKIPTEVVVYTAVVPFVSATRMLQRFLRPPPSQPMAKSIMGFLTLSVDSDLWLKSFHVDLRIYSPNTLSYDQSIQNQLHQYRLSSPKFYISQNQILPANGHCFTATKQILTWNDLVSVEFKPDSPMEIVSRKPYYFYKDEHHLSKDSPANFNGTSEVFTQDGKVINFYYSRGRLQHQDSPKVLEINFTLAPS